MHIMNHIAAFCKPATESGFERKTLPVKSKSTAPKKKAEKPKLEGKKFQFPAILTCWRFEPSARSKS